MVARMDSFKLARNLAHSITDHMQQAGVSVNSAATETGIPRTTLIRKLQFPETYPFTVTEIQKIAALTGSTASQLVTNAERGNDD